LQQKGQKKNRTTIYQEFQNRNPYQRRAYDLGSRQPIVEQQGFGPIPPSNNPTLNPQGGGNGNNLTDDQLLDFFANA
jgi:hypothetical protein